MPTIADKLTDLTDEEIQKRYRFPADNIKNMSDFLGRFFRKEIHDGTNFLSLWILHNIRFSILIGCIDGTHVNTQSHVQPDKQLLLKENINIIFGRINFQATCDRSVFQQLLNLN
jgi:hypothetical protein